MPLIVDKQEKASRIAEAALTVFLKQGFHQTKMADIAVTANVGKGTLYEYFGNKHEILRHVYTEHLKAFESGSFGFDAQGMSPGEQLNVAIEFLIEHLTEWQSIGAIFIDYYSVARSDDEFLELFSGIYEKSLEQFTGMIRACQNSGEMRTDVDAGSAAKMILCFFDGLILYDAVARKESDILQHSQTFLKLFQDSMQPRS